MITVLRGPAAALDTWCAREADRNPRAVRVFPPAHPRSWNGIRNLLASVADRRGRGFVEEVLGRRPAAASLVPGVLGRPLTSEETAERELLAARPESHLSHNLLIQRPLFWIWAELLHDLLDGAGLTLLVSDLARLDRESLAALRALYRRFPETAPDLAVGFDPHRDTPAPDADGLIWESPAEDVWRIALGFQAFPGARVLEVNEEAGGEAPASAAGFEDGEITVEAMRAAFRSFGFAAALRLGLALLAKEPGLTAAQAAEVHGLIGLSAHNRQFLSRGNRVLAEFLERHFRAALAAETDPVRRSCLCYRLAVARGRRQGDFPGAIEWADRALEEAARPEIPPLQAAHLAGWSRNIRAFALMRAGRMDEADTECEMAFALLDRALAALPSTPPPATAPDQLVREAAFTYSLLADNLAALAKMADQRERFVHWKEIADRLGHDFPGLERFEAATWIEIYRERRQLGLALDKARRGLEDARSEQDAVREYEYAVQVADLLYRLGEAGEAFEAFESARDLRGRLGDPRFLRPFDRNAAAAAVRAGRTGEARRLLDRALEEDAAARAQILAELGELAAREGDAAEADARINEAIALAVESGERDTLLAVAVAAGRACQTLNRPEETRKAYEKAVEIAAAGGPDAPPPPASLIWAALLGAWETGSRDPGTARRFLDLAAEALEDAGAWWDLPRVLAVLTETAGAGENPAAADILVAASQRRDCA